MYSSAVEEAAEGDEDDVSAACSLCGKKDTWFVACDVCHRDFCRSREAGRVGEREGETGRVGEKMRD